MSLKYKRFLSIIAYLWENSSQYSPKTIEDIQAHLEMLDIEVGKKALRNDLQFLTSDESIIKVETTQHGRNQFKYYWIQNRLIKIHEVRYLMDAISSARFISEKETKELIEKLKKLISVEEARLIEDQLVYSSSKIASPQFSETVQTIHQAISEKRTIHFNYGRYSINKTFVLSGGSNPKSYMINPYGVIWNEEKYYLIGFHRIEKEIRHFRIDRIRNIEILEENFVIEPGFNLYKYRSKLMNMYTGEDSTIEVIFKNSLLNVVIDRFGLSADIKPIDDEHFRLITNVKVSKGLVNWLLSWGADAEVVYPKNLKDEMKNEAKRLYLLYHEKSDLK